MFKLILLLAALVVLALADDDDGYYGAYDGYGHGDHHSYPKYSYEYGVKDGHTGDHKDAWEQRDGDHVKGGYKLDEPDGTTRVVEYVSDKHNGFNVVVKRIGHAHHPAHYGHGDGHGYGGYGNGYGYGGGYGHGASSYANHNQHHDGHY